MSGLYLENFGSWAKVEFERLWVMMYSTGVLWCDCWRNKGGGDILIHCTLGSINISTLKVLTEMYM